MYEVLIRSILSQTNAYTIVRCAVRPVQNIERNIVCEENISRVYFVSAYIVTKSVHSSVLGSL
jgi:hypothetical protein